jgi:hypothetical protein
MRSVLEYGAQVWHGGLTGEQCQDIERIQRRALRVIYLEMTYDKDYFGVVLKPWSREIICTNLVKLRT